MSKVNLNEQAQEILRISEQHGVEQNFFFITTFKRYQVQIGILNDLEKTIKDEGTLVTKEYVKGRKTCIRTRQFRTTIARPTAQIRRLSR